MGELISQLEQSMGTSSMEDTDAQTQAQSDALGRTLAVLEEIRTDVEAGGVDEAVAQQVAQQLESLRSDIVAAYVGADEQTAQALDTQLGELTQQLIEGRAEEYQDTYARGGRERRPG